jgi:hypothetical protein
MRVAGTVVLNCYAPNALHDPKPCQINAIVSPDLSNDVLVSWHDLVALGVLHPEFPGAPAQTRHVTATEITDRILSQFSETFSDSLEKAHGSLAGPPMHIELQPELAKNPLRVKTVRKTPIHIQAAADKLVEELLQAGIIVPVKEPTDWISPAHFVPKPGGRARLVTDYGVLNKAVKGPVHPFSAPRDLISSLPPGMKCFARLDAVHGYFQVKLDYESSLLTTFLLPSGRYRYTGAPMGLNSSGDVFCFKTDGPLEGLGNWILKIVDDILVCAPDWDTLFDRLTIVLKRLSEAGIILSKKKFAVGTA